MIRIKRFGNLFWRAVAGKEENFTSGSIRRAIFLLSIPMILEMSMESLFAVVDTYFVGKISTDAVSAIGLTESLLSIIYSLAIGISMAATALVARRIGEGDHVGASRSSLQALWVTAGISLIISVVGAFFSKELLLLMGAEETVAEIGQPFAEWMLVGNASIMFLFVNNAIFRGAGNASIAMLMLVISNGLNMALDPLLIFGWGPIPALGLEGAAIATNIGRSVAVVLQFFLLFRGSQLLNLSFSWPNNQLIFKILRLAAGGTGQFLISSASWIFLMRIISLFGKEAVAGYTIAIRVLIFALLPAFGMANAAATLVGQNLGAGKPDRAEKSVWKTGKYNMMFLGTVSVIFFIFAGPIIRLFTTDPDALAYGKQCLQLVCIGYVFYAYGMVVIQSFNGAGDTLTPTIMNIVGFWCFQIPLAYTLAVLLDFGPSGVFVSIAIAESALAVAGIIIFRRGKWKQVKV